jgi:hypothetical protein
VLLTVFLVWPGAARSQPSPAEPPVRLKKKETPKPVEPSEKKTEPVRPKEPKDEPAPPDARDAAEILLRVSQNMHLAEERLGRRDPGENTRQIQRDVLKDLDSLIEQAKRQQRQQTQNASGSFRPRDHRREMAGNQERRQGRRQPKSESMPRPQQQQTANAGGGSDKEKSKAMNKIADLYKGVWGHLPETLRQEMDQYAKEHFIPKYGDLLKQYYATIAEKGHRKGE